MTAERIAELRKMLAEVQPRALAELYQDAGELLDAAEAYIRLTQEGDAGMMERLQKFAALAIEKQRVVNANIALQAKCDALEAACARKDEKLARVETLAGDGRNYWCAYCCSTTNHPLHGPGCFVLELRGEVGKR